MHPQAHYLELLKWIHQFGFRPAQIPGEDLCLCPFTKRIKRYRDFQPHQKRNVYWIPNVKGLRELGIHVELEKRREGTIIANDYFLAFGVTEKEACLSLMNSVRANLAA